MSDLSEQTIKAIEKTTEELEKARESIRNIANELADVIDVIEPTLVKQATRLRQARMTALDELRAISGGVREVRELLLDSRTGAMLTQAERFLRVMNELEEFRACGALAAFVQVFGLSLEEKVTQ